MTVLVYEDNLLWSSRLSLSLRRLGHDPLLLSKPMPQAGDVAIVNLGSDGIEADVLVPLLRAMGVIVIGHAGHKEKELLTLGRGAGCHILATNSELTHKIEGLLVRAAELR